MDRRRTALWATLLGFAVAGGYVAWRWDLGLVWDDTAAASTAKPSAGVSWSQKVHEAFSEVQGGGYRPLSILLGRIGAEAADPDRRPVAFIVLNGMLFGLLAASFFLVARRFVRSDRAAGYAAFLLLASTPVLTGGLVIFAGIQAIVPLCFCLAVLLVETLLSTRSRLVTVGAFLGLAAILFFAPWYREFTGLISLLLLLRVGQAFQPDSGASDVTSEVQGLRAAGRSVRSLVRTPPGVGLESPTYVGQAFQPDTGRPGGTTRLQGLPVASVRWAVVALCLAGFAHALFPTAAMRPFFPELPLAPVWRLGSLGAIVKALPEHVSPGTVIRGVQALHWRIFADLISVLPPIAVVLGAIGFLGRPARTAADRVSERFLWLWFLATFLPFLKVFKVQVHLSYALLPLTILLARHTARLHGDVFHAATRSGEAGPGSLSLRPKCGAALVLVCLLVAIADHALNPWIVHGATRAIVSAIRRQADRLKELPGRPPVLCNALQIQDIAFAARNDCSIWSLRGGTPDPSDAVRNVAELRSRLTGEKGAAYVLDVRVPSVRGQMGARRTHYVVQEKLVSLAGLERVDAVRFRYPFLDPLKLLTPVATIPWPGPPDLEYDFYRGPALKQPLFQREVAADYWLARIAGKDVAAWQPDPILVKEHEGFSIVLLGRRFYAIPVPEGEFFLEKFRRRDYGRQLEGDSLKELKELISPAPTGQPDISEKIPSGVVDTFAPAVIIPT